MAEAPQYVLYEHAAGYGLFRVKEFEETGQILPEVEAAVADVSKFASVVNLIAFEPFQNTEAALENCNALADGLVHSNLQVFLEEHIPQPKKKKKEVTLGISDSKMALAIGQSLPHIKCQMSGVVPEILRGVRVHFAKLTKDLPHHSLPKAQLSLGHSYSRGKVKFNVNRVDNMVIQSIALLDQLDKDVNLFGMRIREWYSYHFPELFKIVPDQYKYVQCAKIIMDRKSVDETTAGKLTEVVGEEKSKEVLEALRTSMGMDISPMDLLNISRFADRLISLTEYRQRLHSYIKDRMHACAPSLTALIGEQVGARLISHAGSLTNLAKYPASTVQILGAEKALFRALKTHSNTPKYGLLFHSSFIGKASGKNKGRISRFLANKCSIASRIDCFTDVPVEAFGEHLKQQVDDRLKYLETGETPKKNISVMEEATAEAKQQQSKMMKKMRKAAKKAKKEQQQETEDVVQMEIDAIPKQTKETKKRKLEDAREGIAFAEEALEGAVVEDEKEQSKSKKRRKLNESVEEVKVVEVVEEIPAAEQQASKKKKKKKSKQSE